MVFLFLTAAGGCGKKGPPVPPGQTSPDAVKTLAAKVDEDVLQLRWEMPIGTPRPTEFAVYQARWLLSEPACKKCPLIFREVARVPAERFSTAGMFDSYLRYRTALDSGYHYVYKVVGFTGVGLASPDSNLVEFDVREIEPEQ